MNTHFMLLTLCIFGAACPERAKTAGLILPYVGTKAMELHLIEISKAVETNAHAIVIMDGAGWHTAKNLNIPSNITLIKLPPYSPELNPASRDFGCAKTLPANDGECLGISARK